MKRAVCVTFIFIFALLILIGEVSYSFVGEGFIATMNNPNLSEDEKLKISDSWVALASIFSLLKGATVVWGLFLFEKFSRGFGLLFVSAMATVSVGLPFILAEAVFGSSKLVWANLIFLVCAFVLWTLASVLTRLLERIGFLGRK